jgi:hypothetical protein
MIMTMAPWISAISRGRANICTEVSALRRHMPCTAALRTRREQIMPLSKNLRQAIGALVGALCAFGIYTVFSGGL